MIFPLKNYGLLISLFSTPLEHEPDFIDNYITDFIQNKYKKDLINTSNRYFTQTGNNDNQIDSHFNHLYKPITFSVYGQFDVGFLMLVDNFEIINRLSLLDYGVPQQFIYGPVPCLSFNDEIKRLQNIEPRSANINSKIEKLQQLQNLYQSHPQFSSNMSISDTYQTLENYMNEFPLMSICQIKVNNYSNIDYGLILLNRLSLKFFEHLPECTGYKFDQSGKFNYAKNNCKIIVFYSLSWNEIAVLLFSDNYSNISQLIMDIREMYTDEIIPQEQLRGDGIEKILLRKYFNKSYDNCRTHAFSATYTTYTSDLEFQRELKLFFKSKCEYFTNQIEFAEPDISSTELRDRVNDELMKLELSGIPSVEPWVQRLNDLTGPVFPITYTNCKPGHFSQVCKLDPPTFHQIPGEDGKYAIKATVAGKGDYIFPRDCPYRDIFKQTTVGCHDPLDMSEQCSYYRNGVCTYQLNLYNNSYSAVSTKKLFFDLYRKRYIFSRYCDFPKIPSDINFDFGTDIYKTWTEIFVPIRFKDNPVDKHHRFTHKMITSKFNGFNAELLRELSIELRKSRFPRSLIAEINNVFALYNSCVRDPYLFDLFAELFPLMYTFYNGLIDYKIKYDKNKNALGLPNEFAKNVLLLKSDWAKDNINYIETAIICRLESGYQRNELMNYNTYYKGGCQDLLSILNGLQMSILRLTDSFAEMGSHVLVGNEIGIKINLLSGVSVVEADVHKLFEPEFLVDLYHEMGHHLLYTIPFHKAREAIKNLYNNIKIPKKIIKDPKDEYHRMLEDVFSDMIQFYFGFLGDVDLFSRHFWTSYRSNFDYNCKESKSQNKTLVLQTLRFILVLYNTSPEYYGEELNMQIFNILLNKLEENQIHHEEIKTIIEKTENYKRLRNLFLCSLKFDLFTAMREIKYNIYTAYDKIFQFYGRNRSTIDERCKREQKFVSDYMLNDLIEGKPILYEYTNDEFYSCLKHASRLSYAFNCYLYNMAMNDPQGQYLECDREGLPEFNICNTTLTRYKYSGGFFVTGDTFRSQHFKVRFAYLISLWDMMIKEKRYLAEKIFDFGCGGL